VVYPAAANLHVDYYGNRHEVLALRLMHQHLGLRPIRF